MDAEIISKNHQMVIAEQEEKRQRSFNGASFIIYGSPGWMLSETKM